MMICNFCNGGKAVKGAGELNDLFGNTDSYQGPLDNLPVTVCQQCRGLGYIPSMMGG